MQILSPALSVVQIMQSETLTKGGRRDAPTILEL